MEKMKNNGDPVEPGVHVMPDPWLYPIRQPSEDGGGGLPPQPHDQGLHQVPPPNIHPMVTPGINPLPQDLTGGPSLDPPPLCAGCNLRIVDKFYLSALDSKWHTSCLKCSECGMELESHISCYERDGLILCKEDYFR